MSCNRYYNPANKIDNEAVLGINGTVDSLAYRLVHVDLHLHTQCRWYGKSTDQSGNDWAAPNITPFQADSGNNDWGTAIKVLGPDDTPTITGMTKFGINRILITDVERDTVYKLQFSYGLTDSATAVLADDYTELMIKFDATNPQQSAGIPFPLLMPCQAVGTKVWVAAWNASDTGTVDFFVGLHEYLR